MDREAKIDLGSCTIASYLDEGFALAVSTSVTLHLPEQYSAVPTAVELRDHVRQGKIWTARASSCHLELSLRFEACVDSREDMKDTLLAAFEACPVWQALGLQLRRETTPSRWGLPPGMLHMYYLQHGSEHSALVTPEGVPCVYISTWHCELSFGVREDTTAIEAAVPKALSKIVTLRLPPKKLRRFAARRQRWNEGMNNRMQKRESDSKSKTARPENWPGDAIVTEEPEFYSFPAYLQNERLEHLIHTALSSVLGIRKRFAGIRVEPSQSLSLLDIAPTIFNALYLQNVVARMRLAPLVSSALSNLASTQSPILRQKVLDFQLRHAIQPHGVREAIQLPITSLILRSTTVPKITIHGRRTEDVARTLGGETNLIQQVLDSGEPLASSYNPSETDGVPICDQWIPKEAPEEDSVLSNSSNLNDNPSILEPWLVPWIPTESCNSYEESDFVSGNLDEDNDSVMLDATTTIDQHDARFWSYSQQPYVETDDNFLAEITSPCIAANIFAHDMQRGPPYFKITYEEDFGADTDMYVPADQYSPEDVHLITGLERAEPFLPELISADICDAQGLYGGDHYVHNRATKLFSGVDIDADSNSDRESVHSISGSFSDALTRHCMSSMRFELAIMEDDGHFGDNTIDQGNDAVEGTFAGSSYIEIKEDTLYAPGLVHSTEDSHALERSWARHDGSRPTQGWYNIPRGFTWVGAEDQATLDNHHPGTLGIDSDGDIDELSYDDQAE